MAGFSREPNATAWFSPCLGRSRIWLVGRRLFPDIRGSTCSSAYARYRDSELASCLGRVRLAENQKREPTRACGATAISRRDAVPGSGSGVILATARRATQTKVALIAIQIAAGFGLNSTKMVNGSSVKKPHNMPKTSQKPRKHADADSRRAFEVIVGQGERTQCVWSKRSYPIPGKYRVRRISR